MKHYEYEISLFLDGELPKELQQELFLHLADCEECRSTFNELLLVKERSKNYFVDTLRQLKNKSPQTNLIYKIGFYASATAAVILLFILVGIKPLEKFYTRNEVGVDTVFIQKEIPNTQHNVNQTNSFNPGKKELHPEVTLKDHLQYVMGLRRVRITSADIIKTKNGS